MTPATQAALVEALTWYAEQGRLCRLIHSEGDAGRNALAADGGSRARAAIAQAAEQPAPVAASVIPRGWKVESMEPWDALTDEANADHQWLVQRTTPPFCDAAGTRHWHGPTITEALRRAHADLGMPYAAPTPGAQESAEGQR